MPSKLKRGKKNIGHNIKELKEGNTYARTRKKFGKKRAEKQVIAIALKKAGLSKKRKKRSTKQ